jgi:hypothetical protein
MTRIKSCILSPLHPCHTHPHLIPIHIAPPPDWRVYTHFLKSPVRYSLLHTSQTPHSLHTPWLSFMHILRIYTLRPYPYPPLIPSPLQPSIHPLTHSIRTQSFTQHHSNSRQFLHQPKTKNQTTRRYPNNHDKRTNIKKTSHIFNLMT